MRARRPVTLVALVGAALLGSVLTALPAAASSTANEIVYTVDTDGDSVYGIALRNLETGATTLVIAEDPVNAFLYDDPELSPDGSVIAFTTDRGSVSGALEGIATVNRNGTGFRRVTNPPSDQTNQRYDAFPAWSPDGATLLFTRGTFTTGGGETHALATVPAVGNEVDVDLLPGGAGGFTADWSPDGTRIVLAQDVDNETGVGQLVVMDADGTDPVDVTGATGALPAWSPDGTTVAFTTITSLDTDRERQADVTQIATFAAAAPTGGVTVLTKTRPTGARSVAEYPAWLPDSRSLVYDFYTYDTDGFRSNADLWAVDRRDVRSGKVTGTAAFDEVQAHVQGPALGSVSAGVRSRYVAVDPERVLDTRPAPDNVGGAPGKVGAGDTRSVAVHGRAVTIDGSATTVPGTATAVVLSVTALNATQGTDVRAYPSGGSVPGASALNLTKGQVVPNLLTVRVGGDGAVLLRNSAGSVDLAVDIAGYYVPTATVGASGFTPVSPSRILDTRPAPDNVGVSPGAIGAGDTLDLTVIGTLPVRGGGTIVVPADASAVVLNLTGTQGTATTDVRAYPTPVGSDVPLVSNLNLRKGQTAAVLAVVPVGDGGRVRLRNSAGSVQLIADLAGYFGPGGNDFVPVDPLRFLDTRTGTGGAPIPVTAGAFVDLPVGGARGVPSDAVAALANLTATGVSGGTDVRAYPSDASSVPTVSNLNVAVGTTRANLAVLRLSTTGTAGQVRLRNQAAQLHLLADLAGFFRPST